MEVMERPSQEDMQIELKTKAQAYLATLVSLGMAEVKHHECKKNVFLDIEVEGRRFQGQVRDDGPIIAGEANFYFGTPYGSTRICHSSYSWNVAKEDVALCQHESEGKISLAGMSDAGVRRVAFELGILIDRDIAGTDRQMARKVRQSEAFYQSNACKLLAKWFQDNPKQVKKLVDNIFLGDWVAAVKAAALA